MQKRVFVFDGNLDDTTFEQIAAADVVVVRASDAYVRGVAHGMGKAVVDGDANDAAIAAARPVWSSFPLADLIEPAAIAEPVRRALQQQRVFTAADLGDLDLTALAAAPGMTRHALTAFIRALSRSERFPDADKLRDFIIRRGIFV